MKSFASRTGIAVAVSAAALSVVFALFVPYGYPWPSVAWAVVACAVFVWMGMSSIRPTPSMGDVIGDVEGESAQAPAAPERGVGSTKAVS